MLPPNMEPDTPNMNPWQRWAHKLAWGCVVLTLFMIGVGAMVTTTRAGDTNPGWSLRFWEWFTSWWNASGGRAWEDGHRVVGTLVGFCGIALAFTMWKGESGRNRSWLGVAALALIAAQGLIGGLRVLVVSDAAVRDTVLGYTGGGYDVELRRAIKAMIHGVTAQVIFSSLCCVMVLTSRRWLAAWGAQRSPAATGTRRLALASVLLAVGQLALGTFVRQTGNGVLWHVCGAFVVSTTVLLLLLRVMRHHGGQAPLRRLALTVGILLACQVFLGVTPYILGGGEWASIDPASAVALMRSAHVVCGALILATLTVHALWVFRLAQPEQARAAGTAAEFDSGARRVVGDFLVLTKVRLSGLVMVTVAAGYFIAVPGAPNVALLFTTMFGVSLVAGGTSALNQLIERERDKLMDRTRNRPLPSGRMQPTTALMFGLGTIIGGTLLVAWGVNLLAAGLTLATSVIYLCIYTPLKTRTTANTLVGAVPGALPPVIGWAAATGTVNLWAFVLFAILFVWQLPHFWSIAWLYREDYRKGGMKMLSGIDDDSGRFISGQIALWCAALVMTSLLPVLVGMASPRYGIGAIVLGLGFLGAGLVHAARRTRNTTRGVFFASLLYLPALLAALLIDVW